MSMSKKISVERYGEELEKIFSIKKMAIFLCGPSYRDKKNPGAKLRKKIEGVLKKEDFEVVLGEDDGLEFLRKKYNTYAHINELNFIKGNHCGAVIIIAHSVGAYCELGLFSYETIQSTDRATDFIVIISKEFKRRKSFLNEGPARAIRDYGKVYYADLDNFDHTDLVERLKRRRSVYPTNMRGRPLGWSKRK